MQARQLREVVLLGARAPLSRGMRRFHGLGVRLVVVALEGLQTRELGEGRLDGVSNQAALRRGLRLPRQPVRRYEAVAVQAENVSRRWSSAVCSGRRLLPS